jgi:phosphonate degradation associated HDIG domain protein
MALTIIDITELLRTKGQDQYGGEAVSQLEHALQCAYLAEQAQETAETITAALLHDIGHLLSAGKGTILQSPAANGDDLHQYIALPFLRTVLPDTVLEPIKLHVDAKRYLCAVDKGYWATLSEASKKSLELQGGIFTDEQAENFESNRFGQEAARLRRYDDLAKTPGVQTPSLEHYLAILQRVAN